MKKLLFCILGRTASGKDTLTAAVCKELELRQLISYTTRPKRSPTESTHIFAANKDFNAHLRENKIITYTKIGDYYYWSTKDQLYENDLYVIDYNGLEYLKQRIDGNDVKLVTVYIDVPANVRQKRFMLREHTDARKFIERTQSENEQFNKLEAAKDWNYRISNERFEDAKEALKTLILSEKEKINEI